MCDFGHLLELQLDSALVKCPVASDIVSAVNDVVRDLANSWYKAYAEEWKLQDIGFLQPSALKRLKFVKQFTKFIKMFQAIHVVAQKQLVQLRPRGSDDPEENLDSVELSEGERGKKEETSWVGWEWAKKDGREFLSITRSYDYWRRRMVKFP